MRGAPGGIGCPRGCSGVPIHRYPILGKTKMKLFCLHRLFLLTRNIHFGKAIALTRSPNPESTMKTEIAFKPVAVPLAVHAELTPNPKGIGDFPAAANVNAVLDGVVNADGKFVVNKFSANR